VRFDHIPGFVGRTKELNQLKKTIYDPTAHRVMSILGLGGLGKSRLALELAYQIYEEPPQHAVYWIQATDQQTLERDVRGIGKMLRIPGIEDPNADVKALVRQRLSDPAQHPWHWLLILDSADDEALWGTGPIESNSSLSEFLPLTTMTNGSILITTRTRRVANFLARREVIELNAVTPDEAADIFDYELNSSYLATNDSSTRELLEKLTYLPLAIVQAASFIRMTQQPVETYLDLLERPEPEVIQLLSEDFGDQTRYPDMKNPVATTWLISFHHIKQHHDLAAKFLSSMACYHEKSIPRSLLPQVDSENDFIKTLAVLTGYSFIRRQMIDPGQEELYDMHRLVHLAARNWLKMEGSLTEWTKICTKRTTRILWDFHHNYWDQDGYKARMWTIYLPHASYLYEYNNAQDQPEWYYLLEIMGYWLIQEGKYHAAVEALTAVAKWKVSKFGTSARETLWTYRDLGEALIRKGDWPAAERCFQQVASQSSMLGQKDVLTLVSRQGLASTYMKLGRWKEAEELQRQLVTTMKVVLGPEHDDTMGVIQDLAWTYSKQGRWKEAEELARQVLTTTKRVLKPEHPSTLTIIHNLAEIYSDQGRLEDVEELQRQLLTTRKRVLGVEHPDTLTSIDSLAFTLMRWGRLKEAEELQRQVLTTSKRALGVEHPHTLISMNNLHFTLMRWGRLKEAEELQRQVLTTSKRALGVVHPNTLTSMNNLALVLKWQGRSDDAMELAASCRELCLESLGPSHHTTQVVSQTLAAWQKATGFEGPQEGRGVSRMPGAWPG
jgi:tetratricopeptide (TPR) repeat protein